MKLNPLAWCAWAAAALAAAFIDRSPYLQALLLIVILNMWLPHRGRERNSYWKLGAMLAVAAVVFSFALSRFGHHTIFRLPGLPIIGGPWTTDALAFGASTGMALLLVVAIFGVLQLTVRSADLISLLPRPLYRAGTVFALAVAFAPQTIAALRSISEARRLRGRRSGWRAAPALLLPLLLTSLERALQYAESLDARGFGSRRRSRYRVQPWHGADLLVAAASALSVTLTILLPATGYSPYQEIVPQLPGLNGFASVLLLVLPAVLVATPRRRHATDLL